MAHNSGGPRADIVRRWCDHVSHGEDMGQGGITREQEARRGGEEALGTPTGILAALPEEFADGLAALLRPAAGDEIVEVRVVAGRKTAISSM